MKTYDNCYIVTIKRNTTLVHSTKETEQASQLIILRQYFQNYYQRVNIILEY
jgi:hypothetical protein